MGTDLKEKITAANAAMFATTARLLKDADDLKRDRHKLLDLLRKANDQEVRRQREGDHE